MEDGTRIRYFTVKTHIDNVQAMMNLLCSVRHIFAQDRWPCIGDRVVYRVEGTVEERKAIYRNVRRLGRGKIRFNIVKWSMEQLMDMVI